MKRVFIELESALKMFIDDNILLWLNRWPEQDIAGHEPPLSAPDTNITF